MTSDVSRGNLLRLPCDYPTFNLESNSVAVADAVRASMSIPFFYRPVELDVPGVTARTIFVDTLGINATDCGISRAMLDQLYQNWRAAATKSLASSGH